MKPDTQRFWWVKDIDDTHQIYEQMIEEPRFEKMIKAWMHNRDSESLNFQLQLLCEWIEEGIESNKKANMKQDHADMVNDVFYGDSGVV